MILEYFEDLLLLITFLSSCYYSYQVYVEYHKMTSEEIKHFMNETFYFRQYL